MNRYLVNYTHKQGQTALPSTYHEAEAPGEVAAQAWPLAKQCGSYTFSVCSDSHVWHYSSDYGHCFDNNPIKP